MLNEPVAVTMMVVDALDVLGVPYLIGGSLASSVHGVVRTTMDVDLVADLKMVHVEPLLQMLGDSFYADAHMIREGIRHRRSFNLLHLETMFKVDIFIHKQRPFDRAQFERRLLQTLDIDLERAAYVASAEDTVLAKLEWYRMGNEISERQWRDVIGVLKVQGERIDRDYMCRMAAELGVVDLLERALQESA